jgi:hypothetical protein
MRGEGLKPISAELVRMLLAIIRSVPRLPGE